VRIFEYRAREREYIPFRNASAGQQANGALEDTAQPAGSAAADRPAEKDLDNPVERDRRAAEREAATSDYLREPQCNLVANGDAELAAWRDHGKAGDQSGGKIAGEGAIEVPEAREAIKPILEGGEGGFNLRREKYGLERLASLMARVVRGRYLPGTAVVTG
jgi:chromosome segregation protein